MNHSIDSILTLHAIFCLHQKTDDEQKDVSADSWVNHERDKRKEKKMHDDSHGFDKPFWVSKEH
jgi:hypothetical protein